MSAELYHKLCSMSFLALSTQKNAVKVTSALPKTTPWTWLSSGLTEYKNIVTSRRRRIYLMFSILPDHSVRLLGRADSGGERQPDAAAAVHQQHGAVARAAERTRASPGAVLVLTW